MVGKLILVLASFLLCFTSVSVADKLGSEVLELEKGALDRWSEGDVYGYIEIAADDISYFDPSLESRIDGIAAFKAHIEPNHKKFSIYRYEILNPRFYDHGNVCVLCFNLNNYNEQGDITSQWNSTEVYRKTGGKWKIIHSHWSKTHTEEM
jgi:ketosteroid isomerase-like protein